MRISCSADPPSPRGVLRAGASDGRRPPPGRLLPRARAARGRRHGGRLPGVFPGWTARRDQVAARGDRLRPGVPRPVPAGGDGRAAHPRHLRGRGARRRRGRGPAVDGHRVRRRGQPRRRGPPARAARPRDADGAGRRPGGRPGRDPRRRRRPPRPQTVQCAHGVGRPEGRRLRHRPHIGRLRPHQHGGARRHRGVDGPRAAVRAARRPGGRRIRLGCVRGLRRHRPEPVRRRHAGRRAGPRPRRRAGPRRPAARARPAGPPGAGEDAGGAPAGNRSRGRPRRPRGVRFGGRGAAGHQDRPGRPAGSAIARRPTRRCAGSPTRRCAGSPTRRCPAWSGCPARSDRRPADPAPDPAPDWPGDAGGGRSLGRLADAAGAGHPAVRPAWRGTVAVPGAARAAGRPVGAPTGLMAAPGDPLATATSNPLVTPGNPLADAAAAAAAAAAAGCTGRQRRPRSHPFSRSAAAGFHASSLPTAATRGWTGGGVVRRVGAGPVAAADRHRRRRGARRDPGPVPRPRIDRRFRRGRGRRLGAFTTNSESCSSGCRSRWPFSPAGTDILHYATQPPGAHSVWPPPSPPNSPR